jgi:hypothetical protein
VTTGFFELREALFDGPLVTAANYGSEVTKPRSANFVHDALLAPLAGDPTASDIATAIGLNMISSQSGCALHCNIFSTRRGRNPAFCRAIGRRCGIMAILPHMQWNARTTIIVFGGTKPDQLNQEPVGSPLELVQ